MTLDDDTRKGLFRKGYEDALRVFEARRPIADTVPAYPVAPDRCPHCGTKVKSWPVPRILEALRAWAEVHGRAPTSKEWDKSAPDHPDSTSVFRVFAGWNVAVRAAGLEPNVAGGVDVWPCDLIVDAINDWCARYGRAPRCREWRRASLTHPAEHTIRLRFGSWNAALRAAGVREECIYPSRKERTRALA